MSCLCFGRFQLRLAERRLLRDGEPVALGSRATDVLVLLVHRSDRVVTKDELLKEAWSGLVVEENNLTVQISTLRKVLGRDAISTVTGRGYRFTLPVVVCDPVGSAEAAAPRRRGNLGAAQPTLFGRDGDIRRIVEACGRVRLVTVSGAGGIGKSSVALAAAQRLAPGFPDGAWVLELAAVRDPGLVVAVVAQCLALALPGRAAPATELAGLLGQRRMLLLLDNCDHVLPGVLQMVAVLLDAAPGVVVLATSRERLQLPGEHVERLAPLALPPCDDDDPLAYGAVQLFVDRVLAQGGQREIAADELADAVRVCRQLDGIALAIELAAARVPLLGIAGVRERLAGSLALLSRDSGAAPSRHQTMRNALQWSVDLLPPQARALLRRLGVFSGGFSIDGAHRVASDTEGDGEPQAVLDGLSMLVERSLLVREPGRRPRYRLLEPLREFALEQLEAAGEAAAWRRRHAVATRDVCRIAVRERDKDWLLAELGNARSALAWAVATPGAGELAVAIATHTSVVLATAGAVPEALGNLMRVGPFVDDGTPLPLAAQYWQWFGRLGVEGRQPTSCCVDALQRAAGMFERLGNRRHLHGCCRMIAEAWMRAGDLGAARSQLERAQAIETEDTPPADRLRRIRIAGLVADAAGDDREALRLLQHALDLARSHGIQRYCLIVQTDLAWSRLNSGVSPAPVADFLEVLWRIEIAGTEGLTLAHALAGRTAALLAAGRLDEARASAPRAIAALRDCGILLTRCDLFAWLAAASGRAAVAAQLVAAADAFHERGEIVRNRFGQRARTAALELAGRSVPPAERTVLARHGRDADAALVCHLLAKVLGNG